MYSTLKICGNDCFHVVSTWNIRDVFAGCGSCSPCLCYLGNNCSTFDIFCNFFISSPSSMFSPSPSLPSLLSPGYSLLFNQKEVSFRFEHIWSISLFVSVSIGLIIKNYSGPLEGFNPFPLFLRSNIFLRDCCKFLYKIFKRLPQFLISTVTSTSFFLSLALWAFCNLKIFCKHGIWCRIRLRFTLQNKFLSLVDQLKQFWRCFL